MSSRKEEERNEKIIRGLMKLPPNRRCINCNSLGPQYVCTTFWTFVCITCSGIHREFTHRVKSVSMAKFTSQEVEALQKGGNQRAREIFLKDWDLQRQRLPDSSNVDRVREFIKNVYVDRKYAGGKISDKPPRDMQSLRNQEDETRRASSYHSYSQSPPYEHQYEDRKYGKPVGVLSRKPGSDKGYYEGKISSFAYSPGRLAEQMYEDRFANEGSSSRVSDYSVSSIGDPFRSDNQSPNFQGKSNSPPMHPLKDILAEATRSQTIVGSEPNAKIELGMATRTQRNTSSSSFGSFDSNSVNSISLIDVVSEPDQSAGTQISERVPVPYVQKSSVSANGVGIDLFSQQFSQQSGGFSAPSIDLFEKLENPAPPSQNNVKPQDVTFTPSIDLFEKPVISLSPSQEVFKQPSIALTTPVDLFDNMNHQTSVATSSEQKPAAISYPQNEGWATFDLPKHETSTFGASFAPHANLPSRNQVLSLDSSMQWPSDLPKHETSAFRTTYTPQANMAPENQVLSMNSNMQWPSANYEPHPPIASGGNHWQGGNQVSPFVVPTSSKGGVLSVPTDQMSTNPFDLPYDSKLETSGVFLDMSTLEVALPDPQMLPYVEDFNQPWFPPNTHTPYIPGVPQGGLTYMAGEATPSHFPNAPPQESIVPLGGNPFA